MSEIHIILDSTASALPEWLAARPNVHIASLTVSLGERQEKEDALSNADLFRLMKETGLHPKTSQPAPGDFAAIISPLIEAGHPIIIITVSGGLSGTVQSAKAAVQLAGAKDVYVIDSETAAIGMVTMAEQALAWAAQGLSAAEIAQKVVLATKKTHTMFVPGTLEFLHKGGRIGGAAALFGAILQIRPILYLVDGKVTVLDKVRTRAKAVNRMLEELKRYTKFTHIGVVHIEAYDEAVQLAEQVRALYPDAPISISTGGPTLASHLGPGLVGIIFQEQ